MNLKKVCYTAFVAFWSSIVTILALNGLAAEDGNTGATQRKYSLSQIAEHASENDCWIAVEGKVYDISTYLSMHPTPPSVLIPWCGKDATQGMRTKGYGRDHSPQAWALLSNYLIGTVE